MSFANVGSFEPTFFYCWRQPPKASAAGKCICPLPSRCGWDSVGVQKEVADGLSCRTPFRHHHFNPRPSRLPSPPRLVAPPLRPRNARKCNRESLCKIQPLLQTRCLLQTKIFLRNSSIEFEECCSLKFLLESKEILLFQRESCGIGKLLQKLSSSREC